MGKGDKEEKVEDFHGQAAFEAATAVIRLLVIAYAFNAVVYGLGIFLFLGQWFSNPTFSLGTAFTLFRTVKTPIVYGYIALQLKQTNEQFRLILSGKRIDQEAVVKGLRSLTNGLQKIKMPLFIGGVMHLVQYWGELFGH
uniref:Uncharacterized protein n=1 Tax=Paramoeba aestuarina TaxID=180227 RepID=A0A7S4NPS6_9EUKA|mmetsp:Transcript_21816/g.33901  ORF Transcript_21816/g.33901 Transcript_21816/m.33901 type:complete len:140 (+) Transcript_21816:162-581(+)|eukprot:CAMPEP_0201536132 /NCGR_PEP_ID=MMETSP0161_2-20130828/61033_1 /ASSEMBLY_ACC=CAM_ASM_000251 /TAXON_ID=180227 /ORGANISM="Neoparamoeba aestuarina, Strain SoJaBio B1-5/56/2" /LENGTH=139 /DNA_ID=CAMNT_0047941649 /DNA_START=886 /DNA_END=1305 /DNA_ORIENTATION=+